MSTLPLPELLALFGHFLLLSLLAVGGAVAAAPEMHRVLVDQQGWLSDAQFTASIALAQAAPGPNILFVAVLGWNAAGPLGVLAALGGMLLPSSLLAWAAARWTHARRESRAVRAFMAGMAPLTVGLLLATGWLLAAPVLDVAGTRWALASGSDALQAGQRWATAALLVAGTAAWAARTSRSPLWAVGAGALAGVAGWV